MLVKIIFYTIAIVSMIVDTYVSCKYFKHNHFK